MKHSDLFSAIQRAAKAADGMVSYNAMTQTAEAMAHAGLLLLDVRPTEPGANERLEAFLRQLEGVKLVARKMVTPPANGGAA